MLTFERESSARVGVHVTKVADGDTITVRFSDGHTERVRLLGIDTPETHHPTKPVGCFGPEAQEYTTRMLNDRDIELEYDVEKKDKYSRTLAYVYLDNERFNDRLVANGFAKVLTIAPNGKYSHRLAELQLDAENHGRGMWGYCVNDN